MYKDFIILFSSSVAPAAWLSDVESGRQAVDSAARGVTAQWKIIVHVHPGPRNPDAEIPYYLELLRFLWPVQQKIVGRCPSARSSSFWSSALRAWCFDLGCAAPDPG
jgi:hypothetical protein